MTQAPSPCLPQDNLHFSQEFIKGLESSLCEKDTALTDFKNTTLQPSLQILSVEEILNHECCNECLTLSAQKGLVNHAG